MEIAAITHGALEGLAYLHSHNMIHRYVCVCCCVCVCVCVYVVGVLGAELEHVLRGPVCVPVISSSTVSLLIQASALDSSLCVL